MVTSFIGLSTIPWLDGTCGQGGWVAGTNGPASGVPGASAPASCDPEASALDGASIAEASPLASMPVLLATLPSPPSGGLDAFGEGAPTDMVHPPTVNTAAIAIRKLGRIHPTLRATGLGGKRRGSLAFAATLGF